MMLPTHSQGRKSDFGADIPRTENDIIEAVIRSLTCCLAFVLLPSAPAVAAFDIAKALQPVRGLAYLDVGSSVYSGTDSDPFNGDPTFSASTLVRDFSLMLFGGFDFGLSWWARTTLRADHVILGEAGLALEVFKPLVFVIGRINNPVSVTTRFSNEELGLAEPDNLVYVTQPRSVTGLLVRGTAWGRLSYAAGYVPADLKAGERTFVASLSISPLGPTANREYGFFSNEEGYDQVRFALGAGGMITWFHTGSETYVRTTADCLLQYKAFALSGGYSRLRYYHQRGSGFLADVNHGGFARASVFVVPDVLRLVAGFEYLDFDAPMTSWASGGEAVINVGLVLHVRKDLLRVHLEYRHRHELDGPDLQNDNVFIAVKLLL